MKSWKGIAKIERKRGPMKVLGTTPGNSKWSYWDVTKEISSKELKRKKGNFVLLYLNRFDDKEDHDLLEY